MLKRRIIPVELLLNGRLVKTVRFDSYRDVGDPIKASQVYYDQDADELILLNIDRVFRDPKVTAMYLQKISSKCFMPISVGGGIGSIDDAAILFGAGADKIIVNSAAYSDPSLISALSDRWGSQAVILSVDIFCSATGGIELRSDCGRVLENINIISYIEKKIAEGAGEILINSINNDGVMLGYNLDVLDMIRPFCTVPLITCGGAGNYHHLKEAFDRGVNAVACGSLFNFGDNNPLRAKAHLKNYNVPLKKI
jgi:cyclase